MPNKCGFTKSSSMCQPPPPFLICTIIYETITSIPLDPRGKGFLPLVHTESQEYLYRPQDSGHWSFSNAMVYQRQLGLEEGWNNTGDGPLRAPGFNYPVASQLEYNDRFSHGTNDFKQSPRLTAREIAMLRVMNALTDKPHWVEKVLDDDISKKWGEEAQTIPLISNKAWEWCLLELRDKARRFKKTGRVLVFDAASRISKSDTKIPETLNQELRRAVQPLLDLPEDEKDWHPGSREQVLDLVHPSLFPLVFDRTRVLMDGGTVSLDFGNTNAFENTKIAPQPTTAGRASKRFQWLPCEVEFTEDAGTDVVISSYINNLHPSNKQAYTAIEKIIALAIPAWNEVLVHGGDGRTPPRIRTYGAQFSGDLPEWYQGLYQIDRNKNSDPDAYKEARRKVVEYCGFEDRDEERDQEEEEDIDVEDEPMSVDEEEIGPEYMDAAGLSATVSDYFHRHVRQLVHPEPGVSFTYDQWKIGLTGKAIVGRATPYRRALAGDEDYSRDDQDYYSVRIQDDFRDEGLQVIVKLASIELAPDKPVYAGGSWHVEGLLHEHIVATALYYYDVENVTEARVSFRTEAVLDDMEMRYEQGECSGIKYRIKLLASVY